jgi:hypothetical protein
VVYPYYGKYDFAMRWGYDWFDTQFGVLSRHIIGYSILGFFFKGLALPLGILDELAQHFIKDKAFSWGQMGLNLISALVGIGISKFISISFKNPWKKGR